MLHVEIEKIVNSSRSFWAHAYLFSGELVVFVSVKAQSETTITASEYGQELVGCFNRAYYRARTVKQAFKSVNDWVGENRSDLSVICVVMVFDTHSKKVEIGVLGKGQIIILRAGRLAVIASGDINTVRFVSGKVCEGDRFICAAEAFLSSVPFASWRSIMALHPSRAVVEFAPGKERAAVFVAVHAQNQSKIPQLRLNLPKITSVVKIAQLLHKNSGSRIYLKPSAQEVYVGERKTNRKTLVLGLFVFGLLIFGVVFGVVKRDRILYRQSYEVQLSAVLYAFDQAQDLVDVHPVRSRELAREVRAGIDKLSQKGITDPRFIDLQKKSSQFLPKLLGEYFVEPKLLFDLQLMREGLGSNVVNSSSRTVVVLDARQKVVASFDFEGKNASVLGGSDIASAKLVAVNGNIFVLDGQRVVQINDGGVKTAALSDGKWREPVFLGNYGGNLYVVDRGNTQVWRYSAGASGFEAGHEWLSTEAHTLLQSEFDKTVSFAIDGSIWALTNEGKIIKLTQGRQDVFVIQGLEKKFLNPVSLTTHLDARGLYILDKGNNRVVVLDKSGVFKAEYIWQGFGQASSIVVSEEQKRLIIFVESKVYAVDLSI